MPTSLHPRLSPLAAALGIASATATLSAQTEWTFLSPANSPPALTAHSMTYYLPFNHTVLFGGIANGMRSSDTWIWDGTNWSQAAPTNVPPARVAHSMAYDENRATIVMFGGIDATGMLLDDTWEWNGIDWTLMTSTTPPPPARRSHPMAYLPSRGTVVLFGGVGGATGADLNDLWEWNGIDWAQITTANAPQPRRATDMAYDPVNGGLLIFSGYLQADDTWRFDGTDWQQLTPTTSPAARYDHSMVTDTARNRIVMFAGASPSDTWEWDGSDWLQRTPASLPAPRLDTYLAYDLVREEVLMYGSVQQPEMWSYAVTDSATFTTNGSGCAGSAGTPVITTAERPWLGETFTVQISPVPNNGIGLMLYGLSDTSSSVWGPLPTSLAAAGLPGCDLQVDPALIDVFVANGNTATWSRPLPNDPQLLGGQIYCQGAALDPGVNAFGAVVANYGVMTIGGK
ncbi:MAG: kelch repeat-containing protein [Planctomycetota bacterium]